MKRFTFNLEKVMELRKYREEETKLDLGRAVGALSEIENNIAQAGRAHKGAAARRFQAIAAPGGGAQMLAWDNYLRRLEQETERLLKEAAEAELVVEEKRETYLSASRDLKVMEKLKEKREKEYRAQFFANETRELDDLYRAKK